MTFLSDLTLRQAMGFLLVAATSFLVGTSSLLMPQQSVAAMAKLEPELMQDLGAMTTSTEADAVLADSDPQTALERNLAIPAMGGKIERAGRFAGIPMSSAYFGTATNCLAQAIYYEAALEPETGRRAVAQVVLNRVRHPAYPNTVCGVVYQGWNQPVCQFSFTCDGALMRRPRADLWRNAQAFARDALSGYEVAEVGTATHYHADYVVPYWAFRLGKIGQIGRHIFYRFPDGWGRAAAFTQGWRGAERMPDRTALLARVEDIALAEDIVIEEAPAFTPGLTVVPDVTDRHAPTDVGGRIDTTKEWRLSIPDPVKTPGTYRAQPVVAGDPMAEAAQ